MPLAASVKVTFLNPCQPLCFPYCSHTSREGQFLSPPASTLISRTAACPLQLRQPLPEGPIQDRSLAIPKLQALVLAESNRSGQDGTAPAQSPQGAPVHSSPRSPTPLRCSAGALRTLLDIPMTLVQACSPVVTHKPVSFPPVSFCNLGMHS